MLSRLAIQNYALIRSVEIDFDRGLSIITGETGAGKSIMLGALGLLTGDRADSSVLLDTAKKCVVEGSFSLASYSLQPLFEANDLDYEENCLIRREISLDGRSRAFINDTPVTLSILKELGSHLIDVHSQHNTQYLNQPAFQLHIVDSFANLLAANGSFGEKFKEFKKLSSHLDQLLQQSEAWNRETDFLQHQFEELQRAGVQENEQEALEEELTRLTHCEEILRETGRSSELLAVGELNITGMLREAIHSLGRVVPFFSSAESVKARLESTLIELRDIDRDLSVIPSTLQMDPQRLEKVSSRLDLLYSLMHKHRVNSLPELLAIANDLERRLKEISTLAEEIEKARVSSIKQEETLHKEARILSEQRKKVLPLIEQKISSVLHLLGMPDARFRIDLQSENALSETGYDRVSFLFSAHSDLEVQPLTRIASGGELSRIMLSVKAVIADTLALPTLIFDEIDSGVSGEIADKMGRILSHMAGKTQIINITHLPQVAAKGSAHYHVYKDVTSKTGTQTRIRHLTPAERVQEVARMLSGEIVTEAALENARHLLGLHER